MPTQTKNCPKCGALIVAALPNCPVCGHAFFSAPLPTFVPHVPVQQVRPKKRFPIQCSIALGLLLLLGIVTRFLPNDQKYIEPPFDTETSKYNTTEQLGRSITLGMTKSEVENIIGHTEMSTEGMVRIGVNTDYVVGRDPSAWLYGLPDNGVLGIRFNPDGNVISVQMHRRQQQVYAIP